ncbi:maleylpyruvate isomerase family mycothiol-dependent enzyme [Streptomyces antimycoticus]|uniref:maleylpyruvate isomerase family mycothiol-dependent enzyme n=1 Tax=Streptomyces antimycoticus TaxID=68175 RepID=UPI0033E86769
MDCGVPRELLDDLTAEFDSLRTLVPSGTNLRLPTPAVGWDVGAGVSHLIGCDLLAEEAVGAPGEFRRARPATDVGPDELLEGHITARKDLPMERLRQEWADAFAAMLRAFTSSRREQRVPWFGPPMSPAPLATARLMEYLAHGQDVADVLKIVRRPTDRLRHVCHLGFVTFEFSFANRGLPVPPSPPRVELRLPSGGHGPAARKTPMPPTPPSAPRQEAGRPGVAEPDAASTAADRAPSPRSNMPTVPEIPGASRPAGIRDSLLAAEFARRRGTLPPPRQVQSGPRLVPCGSEHLKGNRCEDLHHARHRHSHPERRARPDAYRRQDRRGRPRTRPHRARCGHRLR